MKPMEAVADDIARWLRDYAQGAGARGYVVGLSGGIDSATVAALCQRAMGDDVLAVLLPCHSADEDRAMAQLVVDAFDLRSITVDLSDTYDHLLATLPPDLGRRRRRPGAPGRPVQEPGARPGPHPGRARARRRAPAHGRPVGGPDRRG
ncbi:MAG: asparagine synthase-related protein [Anaerolineae bacterium]